MIEVYIILGVWALMKFFDLFRKDPVWMLAVPPIIVILFFVGIFISFIFP